MKTTGSMKVCQEITAEGYVALAEGGSVGRETLVPPDRSAIQRGVASWASWEPAWVLPGADGSVRQGIPDRRRGGLLEALVKAGPDLLGGQLCPLPLFLGDDDSGGRDTCDTGETENLPEVHDQETLL